MGLYILTLQQKEEKDQKLSDKKYIKFNRLIKKRLIFLVI